MSIDRKYGKACTNASIKIHNAWKKVLSSDFADKEYAAFEKVCADSILSKESIDKITDYTSVTPAGKVRQIDFVQFGVKPGAVV
jgi:hypothetical protein